MKTTDFIIRITATFLCVGYLPLMPGTFASITALALFYLTRGNEFIYLFLTLGLIAAGLLVSGKAERIFGRKDPPEVVIDEVCGMLLSLIFIPYNIGLVIAAFIIFRILDIFKIYPAARIQKLSGSIGIMGDDIIAGLYTNIILQVFLRLASLRVS